jgi:pyridoxine 5'-phosphate synthase PdxJ
LSVPEIEELNIGYAIVVRALSAGLSRAVTEMVQLLRRRQSHALQTT